MKNQFSPRKQDVIVEPKSGTNRAEVVRLMQQHPLTWRGKRYLNEYLASTTHCPAVALFLVEDVFLREDGHVDLEPIRVILIKSGYYKELTEIVYPRPLLFGLKGKAYYYPHRIPFQGWLDMNKQDQ